MGEHFDRSSTGLPFLLRYQEPGPAPVEITGSYDPSSQTWVHPAQLRMPTYRTTSTTTTRSTSRSTMRTTFRNGSHDHTSDSEHDTDFDTNFDSATD